MLLNCGVGGNCFRVPWTARRSNHSILKEINLHWKEWCWSWSSKTSTTWYEDSTHWKRPWHWERLKAGGEGDDRGWDGWMASQTQWTWVWVSSGSWWWTGKPGVLQSMGSQRAGHDWATELNWKNLTTLKDYFSNATSARTHTPGWSKAAWPKCKISMFKTQMGCLVIKFAYIFLSFLPSLLLSFSPAF